VSEPVRLAWRDGEVSGEWDHPPSDANSALVLGHGAGGSMRTPQLVAIADALAGAGIAALRFNFPYAEAGRRGPDKQDRLEACFWGVAKEATHEAERVYLGGRSLGGRIASHIVADGFPAAGLVFISYPLHPPGKPERIRDSHLARIGAPMLFLSGSADPFATPDLLERTVKGLRAATLHWFDGGDHSLKVRGRTPADVTAEIVETILSWANVQP